MSAAVLRDPWRVQTIEDDRESAVHVLTLLALRHINHHELDQVASYLAIYNQVYYRLSGGIQVATGGLHKGDQFASSMFPTFTSDPLNRLLSVLSETFSARYTKAYSDEAIKKSINFMVSRTPVDLTNAHRVVGAYFYGSRMESLKKPNWLVEVFNEHLESYDWPSDDKASDEPSSLLTNSGSG
jgi:hypothetical protein